MSKITTKYLPVNAVAIASEGVLADESSQPNEQLTLDIALSMLRVGQLQPIGVCKSHADDKPDAPGAATTVIFGRNRLRAARKIVEWKGVEPEKLPEGVTEEQLNAFPGIMVMEQPRPRTPVDVIISENMLRRKLTASDRQGLAKRLRDEYISAGIDEVAATKIAAKRLGVSVQTIRLRLKAAELAAEIPEVREAVDAGKMAEKEAAAMAEAIRKVREKAEQARELGDDDLASKFDAELELELKKAKKKASAAAEKAEGKRAKKTPGRKTQEKAKQALAEHLAENGANPYVSGAIDMVAWILTGDATPELGAIIDRE